MSATNNNNAKTKVAMMDAASALALLGGPASDLILAESTPSSNSTSNERTITAAGNHVLAFPKTLIEMMDYAEEMNNKANKDSNSKAFCVAWLPDGNSFIVRDPAEFARSVIPKFFKPSKFASFARKLYRWGFRQFTSPDTDGSPAPLDAVAFSAPFFKRDARHELSKMKNYSSAEKKRNGHSGAKHVVSKSSTSRDNGEDSSSENSQGPLKRRKLRQSAISPITDDGYEKDGKTNSDSGSSVRFNFNASMTGSSSEGSISNIHENVPVTPSAVNSAQAQRTNNNNAAFPQFQQHVYSASAQQADSNQALLQAYLGNVFANNSQNSNSTPSQFHCQIANAAVSTQDVRRFLTPQPQNQARLPQSTNGRFSEGNTNTNFVQGGAIPNNNDIQMFAHQAAMSSAADQALIRQIMSSAQPRHVPSMAQAPPTMAAPTRFAMPTADQQTLSVLNIFLAQNINNNTNTSQPQMQASLSTFAASLQQQQQQQQQQQHDVNGALSYLANVLGIIQ